MVELNDKRERLFSLVKLKGPILPADVSKEIGTDIMMAGAMLSELVSDKRVKITSVKIGGSPLYYIDGQEYKLQDLMKYLNSKDKEIAEKLRSKKVIRDNDCKPLERVSLRQIKDYAIPIKVNNNNQIEIFWRWYLYSENEAKERIIEILKPKIEVMREEVKEPEIQRELEIEKPKEPEEKKVEEKPRKKRKPRKEDLGFEDRVLDYFNKNGIEIVEEKLVKKNREMNYTVRVSSGIGKLDYFVKVKNKARISEADLSLAFNEAGKLPLLFISNGSLSKKAEDTLRSILKGTVFKKI